MADAWDAFEAQKGWAFKGLGLRVQAAGVVLAFRTWNSDALTYALKPKNCSFVSLAFRHLRLGLGLVRLLKKVLNPRTLQYLNNEMSSCRRKTYDFSTLEGWDWPQKDLSACQH